MLRAAPGNDYRPGASAAGPNGVSAPASSRYLQLPEFGLAWVLALAQ